LIIYDVTDNAVNKLEAQRVNQELQVLSRTDKLTQLYNRGYWQDRLEQEFNRFVRNTSPCSLVMFDIDHFKKVNDTYGHPAGDKIISLVGETLRKIMRKTDIAGRYGGEEFAVILVDTDAAHAQGFCERLRTAIEAIKPVVEGIEIPFTISLGIAELDEQTASAKEWLANTDQALYQSKHGGRNQTQLFKAKS
jgi:diguanylate cyclase (GGDEF)-like protein